MTMITNPLTSAFWLWLAHQLGGVILGGSPADASTAGQGVLAWLAEFGWPTVLGMSLFAVGPVTRFLAENSFTFSDFLGALGVGLLTACIPEGVAYHYLVAYRLDLSAYANPLGLAFIISNNPMLDGSVKYDATSGLRLTYYSPIGLHANVHAQARFTAGYGVYPNVGFGLGYSFGHRRLGE